MVYKPEIIVDLDTGAIVAAEVRPGDAHDAHGATDRILAAEQRLLAMLPPELVEAHPAKLTVLPETAIPAFYDQLPLEFIDELRQLARRRGGDLIFGVPTGEGEQYWNSAVTLGTSPEQQYRKRHLVPFGEIIPPGFDWFLKLVNIPLASFTRGDAGQAPLAVAGQYVAANICYEDAFGEEIAEALPQATLLANLSNTAWFGHSLAQPQHLQIARMRTLESQRPMIRTCR